MHTARDQQKFCGREFTREEVSLIQEVVKACGGPYPLGCAVGRKPTTAATFQGACKPVSLSGIRNALRGAAPVFGLRDQAPAGSGRGRMDRGHQRHGAQVKTVLVYSLVKNAVRRLRDGG